MSGITEATEPLEVRLLGPLTVLRAGRPVSLPASRKTRALLGFLVATGRQHTRSRLAELLWEGPADPRASLRWSLWKLRRVLTDGAAVHLVANRERVQIDVAGLRVDVLEVRAVLARGAERASTAALEDACARFRGELLEGLDLRDCYRYQSWCVTERGAFRKLHVALLSTLVVRLRDAPEKALAYARAWVAADPAGEDGHAEVVRLLGELGRVREAIEQYDVSRRMLLAKPGARPPARLERARAALPRIAPGAPPAAVEHARAVHPPLPALVGRLAEGAAIDRAVSSVSAGRCRVHLLISGDPGIGKSRLLEELALRVERAGGSVVRGRALEAERMRPCGPWIDALAAEERSRLRTRLAPIVPRLGASDDLALHRGAFFDAIVEWISQLASERPTAVVLDDIQWLDDVSASLLHFAVRSLGEGRLLFALGSRSGELQENAACLRAVRALLREGRLTEIPLRPLDPAATAQLVATVGADVDAARVWIESKGNPLLALEVARALRRGGVPLSHALERLVVERLPLDEASREILPWLAVCGPRISPVPLATAMQLPAARVVAALEHLERLAIVKPAGEDSYEFVNDLFRRAAYRRIPGLRRRLLHLRMAEGLAGLPDSGAMPDGP